MLANVSESPQWVSRESLGDVGESLGRVVHGSDPGKVEDTWHGVELPPLAFRWST